MSSALRSQVALIGLLAVMLIPIGTSSLRGLTHILSCRETRATPFTIDVLPDKPPIVSSSAIILPNPDGTAERTEVCGGLALNVGIASRTEDRAQVLLAIANNSDLGWHGTVHVRLDDTLIPIAIGEISAGSTATDEVTLTLDAGRSYEVSGTLLIGP